MTNKGRWCIIGKSAREPDTWSSIEVVITGTTGNRVYPKRVPRVQIPPAPPEQEAHPKGCASFIFDPLPFCSKNPHPGGWGFFVLCSILNRTGILRPSRERWKSPAYHNRDNIPSGLHQFRKGSGQTHRQKHRSQP